ncbi:MAG: protein jag [Eubacteriales bacterium]|nr:protein jag [Eubacteriales bacterium]
MEKSTAAKTATAKLSEKTGRTVQEAIELALEELNVTEDMADIEILDEGSKGIFGLGGKSAKVRATLKEAVSCGKSGACDTDDFEERGSLSRGAASALDFLLGILERMSVDAAIDVTEDEESVMFSISGADAGIIIGRRGETLDSLQYLTGLVVNREGDSFKRVLIDIENYRKKREETLIRLADRLADRVVSGRKSITLEPMNPYERRIIHASLQKNEKIRTYSIGEEPNRKVVISIK